MAEVDCDIRFGSEENENGDEIECTYATCTRCDMETMSFGTHADSIKRCLALMREECPNREKNYYVES